MKAQWCKLLVVFLAACNTQPQSIAVEKTPADTSLANSRNTMEGSLNAKRDTLKLNGKRYVIISKNDRFNCLTSMNGDTVVKSEDYYFEVKFPDINQDGFKDIRIFVISNTPNQCDNYFYDKTLSSFRYIQDCDLDIKRIAGTDFFTSYNRAGCGDRSWESHLSKIQNWTEVDLGLMAVHSCGDKNDGINIYKIVNNNNELLQTLPTKEFDNNGKNNKWNFYKTYWSKNYRQFEQ